MPEPTIAAKQPAILDLDPGTYWWCSCGRSAGQPFCDGSHAGSEFVPKEIRIETRKRVALCQCKRTHDAPRCDGTHREL